MCSSDLTEAILGPDPLRNKPGCYAENADFWHDRGVNIDPFMADSEVLWKFRKAPETEGVDFLPQIANKWQSLKTNDIKTYRDAKKALMATLYGNVKIPELVAEAAKAGLKQQLFETVQERVLLRKTDTYETIPSIVAEEGDYRMFRLEKDDYRGLFLGVYTNCCQHVGGVGHTCAWHGFENQIGRAHV